MRRRWRQRAAEHAERIDAYVAPHLARRETRRNPVFDFLFTYYSHRPAQLRRWHPATGGAGGRPGVRRAQGLRERRRRRPSRRRTSPRSECSPDPPPPAHRHRRPHPRTSAASGCTSGRWSTGSPRTETRHADWPLRLGPAGTDEVVEGPPHRLLPLRRLPLLHAPARPLNTLSPGRDDRPDFRAARLPARGHGPLQARLPALPAHLLRPRGRLLRAGLGHPHPRHAGGAVRPLGPGLRSRCGSETAEGKAQYAEAQRGFAQRGAPLRARLAQECEWLLALD